MTSPHVSHIPASSIAASESSQQHLGWLDGIRGAAALYVLIHHAVMQVPVIGDHANDVLYRIIQLITSFGHYAVDVFIVLSGFCLMLPIMARQQFGSVRRFYLRRTIRIVLPYYAALGFALFLIHFFLKDTQSVWSLHSLPVTLATLRDHLLLSHQWFEDSALKVNGAFWSVGVEYQIYFLFPFFYFLGRKIGFLPSCILVSLLSYVLWGVCYYLSIFNPTPTGTSIYYCSLFFMGMTAAYYACIGERQALPGLIAFFGRYPRRVALIAVGGIGFTAVTSFIVERLFPDVFFPLQMQSFFVGLFASVYLLVRSRYPAVNDMFSRGGELKGLGYVGVMGFSIYLLHDPIVALSWSYLVEPMKLESYSMQAISITATSLLLTLIAAIFFYKWVELPCHQLSKSIQLK